MECRKCDSCHTLGRLSPIAECPGLRGSAREAPGADRQSQALPNQVGRKNQKPGHRITRANLLAQRTKEVAISLTAVCAEYTLPNQIDRDRHQNKSKEQQASKQSDFFARDFSQV